MRVQVRQVQRQADGGFAAVTGGPTKLRSTAGLVATGGRAGDVGEVTFVHDRRETERMADHNNPLIDEHLGRDG